MGTEVDKEKWLQTFLVKSLEIEGCRTEERMAEHARNGTFERNPQLPIANAINVLKLCGGKEVLPDLIRFREEFPRLMTNYPYSLVVDSSIFELEHDLSKPINIEGLRLSSVRTEMPEGNPLDPRQRIAGSWATNTYAADGDMAVRWETSWAMTNRPAFCAFAEEVLVDGRVIYGGSAPRVRPTEWSGSRVHRISLKGLTNGVHNVTIRIADTDIAQSTTIRIVPKEP